jgi:uncharacterized protein (TIGR02147 family)
MGSIFDYRDYKSYLSDRSIESGLRSGFKSGLANACGCNSACISNVLRGNAHLSAEQANSASFYLKLTPDEMHYFLLILQRARAGTTSLRAYFDVQKRLGMKERLSKSDQAKYYGSWFYAAVHVALSIPRLSRSEEALAEYLGLSIATVKKTLDFLVTTGLAVYSSGRYTIGERHLHLGKNSENIKKHHQNWRIKVLHSLENDGEQELHYSSAVTLSRDDAFKVREILLSAIKNSVDLIVKSPEEDVFALIVDFIALSPK